MTTPSGKGGRPSSTDDQLMVEVKAGNAAAFGELYDRYARQAYRLALSICRNEHRAEDAVQDAFLSIWRSRATFEPSRGAVGAWLLTVVRYRALDVVRLNRTHVNHRVGDAMLDGVPAPGDVAEQVAALDDASYLRKMLAGLPDAQRVVITLAYFRQLTHTEIATRLDLPLGTVKGRMRLGLNRLQTTIEAAA